MCVYNDNKIKIKIKIYYQEGLKLHTKHKRTVERLANYVRHVAESRREQWSIQMCVCLL